ncbi:hypothetical protein QVD17_04887 [Tagetes erecta]|uniref:Uncharacterized protein n=1 Tax=Tagetes erecta TaxID=13708 RepID=A0AAD8LCS0_TARER|nr:hypothetical protein QVD17_04887 [Tagetes erecta]
MALRKLIALNLLTSSIVPSGAASHFLNTDTRSIHNFLRTTYFFLRDSQPWTPVRMMSRALNSLESGILRRSHVRGTWLVWQNTEALLLHRYVSKGGKEKVKVIVERNNGNIILSSVSKQLDSTGKQNTLDQYGLRDDVNQPAVLIIECKLVQIFGLDESEEEGEDFDTYTIWIDLQRCLYNTSAIKIKETNKVLEIIVPKLKPEWIDKVGIKWEWKQKACGATVSI